MRRDLVVPEGKWPLDVLAEQGEEICNTWIFLHESVVSKLRYNSGDALYDYLGNNMERLIWKAWEGYPETRIVYRDFGKKRWRLLTFARITGREIYNDEGVTEPEEVIFVKMEGA